MANSTSIGRTVRLAIILLAGGSLAACASVQPRYPSKVAGASSKPDGAAIGGRKVGQPYQVGGIWYVPKDEPGYDRRGVASWYGDAFHLKATANGETFDMNSVSAAHTTLPLPSMVEVTNLDNGRKLLVRVNDRGPFVDNRIIDLSREAAIQLGFHRQGLANVRVRYVGPAPLPADGLRYASARPLATRPAPAAATPIVTAATTAPDPVMEWAAGSSPPRAAVAQIVADEAISTQSLPPITGSAISSAPIGSPSTLVSLAAAPASTGLRIQAGAFSSQVNAQRAVAQLTPTGAASIETVQQGDLMLYRVVLPAPADEAAAYALRDRVAEIGFTEARVVRVF